MIVPFVGPSYEMDSLSFDAQRAINYMPIVSEAPNSKSGYALRPTPGLNLFAEVGGGPIRGGIVTSKEKRAYIVSGFEVYELASDGTSTLLGRLNSGTGRVRMRQNRTQVMISDGVTGYIITISSNALAEISDSDFPGSKDCAFLKGYFVTLKPDSDQHHISNLNNGLVYDALDFATAESGPDETIAVMENRDVLFFFGNRTVEPHQNLAAGTTFPFRPIPNSTIPTGCAATHTVQKFDNALMWLGVDEEGRGVVWQTQGYNAVRKSTQAIEKRINSAADFEESYAWVYHQQGHLFYCLQIKGLDTTLVYDAAIQQWHERSYYNQVLNRREQHRGSCHFFFNQKNLVGDRETGKIYEISLGAHDDAGDEIHRERIGPHYDENKELINFAQFELDVEVGRGTLAGQGSDPVMLLRYSKDGGNTWSRWITRSLGKRGEYKKRVRWNRLSTSRDRVFHVRYTDPVFAQINEAYLNGK